VSTAGAAAGDQQLQQQEVLCEPQSPRLWKLKEPEVAAALAEAAAAAAAAGVEKQGPVLRLSQQGKVVKQALFGGAEDDCMDLV
jgi:hypothetical protein